MSAVKITTYRVESNDIRAKKRYDSYEEFVFVLEGLCKLTSFKAEIIGWDNCMGNFYLEDEYGVFLIGIIEVVGNHTRLTLDEFFETIN